MKTSLLLSIYKENTVDELNRCFESINNQTKIPDEIVFVLDGPIGRLLTNEINKWCKKIPIRIFKLSTNMGLAYALNFGIKRCTNDWVFRMDIDDVCAEDRFKKQIEIINSNPDIDILGGNILCFKSYPNFFLSRTVPTSFNEILRFMKFRNPLNHSTVIFNRIKILQIGAYPKARLGQDYLLWINAVKNGLKIQNTKEVLVFMKVDKNSHSRRGLRNLKYDSYPYLIMYKNKMINIFELFVGLTIRFAFCSFSSIRSILNL